MQNERGKRTGYGGSLRLALSVDAWPASALDVRYAPRWSGVRAARRSAGRRQLRVGRRRSSQPASAAAGIARLVAADEARVERPGCFARRSRSAHDRLDTRSGWRAARRGRVVVWRRRPRLRWHRSRDRALRAIRGCADPRPLERLHGPSCRRSNVHDRSLEWNAITVVGIAAASVLRALGVFGPCGDPRHVAPFTHGSPGRRRRDLAAAVRSPRAGARVGRRTPTPHGARSSSPDGRCRSAASVRTRSLGTRCWNGARARLTVAPTIGATGSPEPNIWAAQ